VTTSASPLRWTRRARWCWASKASSRAPRSAASDCSRAALPPGPAHRSTQSRSGPSRGAAARATAMSWLPSSCTPARPCVTALSRPGSPSANRTAYGDHGPGVPPLCATSSSRGIRRATRCTSGRVSSAARAAPVCHRSPPRASRKAPAIHRGWLCSSASAPRRSSAGASCVTQAARSLAATLRRTALTKATGPAETTRRARSTVAETAACGGMRVRSSWCAPSRRTSSTGGSTWASGRSTQAARTASYRPWPRRAP
jgi:hypothetical protein